MRTTPRVGGPQRAQSAVNRSGVGIDVDDLGDAVHTVSHDALDAGLQGLSAGRARSAGPHERHGDDTGHLVDIAQHDVAAVGLEGGSDGFDGLFDFCTHESLSPEATGHPDDGKKQHRALVIEPGGAVDCVLMVSAGRLALLAHQGGWDEILLVSLPILVILGLLVVARRRAERISSARRETDEPVKPVD